MYSITSAVVSYIRRIAFYKRGSNLSGAYGYTRLNKNWTDSGTHFSSVVARDLAEGFVAIDDGIVDDLSVSQEETAVGCQSTLMSPKIENPIHQCHVA